MSAHFRALHANTVYYRFTEDPRIAHVLEILPLPEHYSYKYRGQLYEIRLTDVEEELRPTHRVLELFLRTDRRYIGELEHNNATNIRRKMTERSLKIRP